jgi:hypothetical protein
VQRLQCSEPCVDCRHNALIERRVEGLALTRIRSRGQPKRELLGMRQVGAQARRNLADVDVVGKHLIELGVHRSKSRYARERDGNDQRHQHRQHGKELA